MTEYEAAHEPSAGLTLPISSPKPAVGPGPAGPPHLTVTMAGMGVTVACNSHGVLDRLRKRYRGFLAGGQAMVSVEVTLVGDARPGARPNVAAAFQGGRLRFTEPGYQGMVDVDAGRAVLSLSSCRPVEEIDHFLRVVYALLAFREGGLLIHSAGIERGGHGFVFFGHSGSGKTTVARLCAADRLLNRVLNDDLVVLAPMSRGGEMDHWHVHSTPFWNPSQVTPCRVDPVPVVGLYRLVQARQVGVETLGPGQALAEVVSNAPVVPLDPGRCSRLLRQVSLLLAQVPAYHLYFRQDDSFWLAVEATVPTTVPAGEMGAP